MAKEASGSLFTDIQGDSIANPNDDNKRKERDIDREELEAKKRRRQQVRTLTYDNVERT
jgi:hypothetical protein